MSALRVYFCDEETFCLLRRRCMAKDFSWKRSADYDPSEDDGKTWSNMPGSPITVKAAKLKVGAYQTTYSQNYSWAKLGNYVIYK